MQLCLSSYSPRVRERERKTLTGAAALVFAVLAVFVTVFGVLTVFVAECGGPCLEDAVCLLEADGNLGESSRGRFSGL